MDYVISKLLFGMNMGEAEIMSVRMIDGMCFTHVTLAYFWPICSKIWIHTSGNTDFKERHEMNRKEFRHLLPQYPYFYILVSSFTLLVSS